MKTALVGLDLQAPHLLGAEAEDAAGFVPADVLQSFGGREPAARGGVGCGAQGAASNLSREIDQHEMGYERTGVSPFNQINYIDEAADGDFEPGLLAHLPRERFPQGFAGFNTPAGQAPFALLWRLAA